MTSDTPCRDIEAEAAEWVVRLDDPAATAATRAAFDAWRAGDPLRAEAYAFARSAWLDMAALPGMQAPTQRGPRPWRALPAAGLACLALALIAALVIWDPLLRIRTDYAGQPGVIRHVTLPDGSQVDLAPGSALALDYDGDHRSLRLLRGEAYFTVAPLGPDETRPFTVHAGGLSATALGTQFMVDQLAGRVSVHVTEHDVAVADGASRLIVSQGQSVDHGAGTGFGAVRSDDDTFATAWRDGLLVFDDRPLGEVVARLNQYYPGWIRVQGQALAARRVSGTFAIDGSEDAVQRIASALNLRLRRLPPLLTVLSDPAPPEDP